MWTIYYAAIWRRHESVRWEVEVTGTDIAENINYTAGYFVFYD